MQRVDNATKTPLTTETDSLREGANLVKRTCVVLVLVLLLNGQGTAEPPSSLLLPLQAIV